MASDETRVTLRQLDLFVDLPITKARQHLVTSLAKELAFKPDDDDEECLVSADVLPKDDADTYFLWFHVDRNDDRFFCHLVFMPKPGGTPPRPATERRRAGKTLEWALTQIRELTGAASQLRAAARLQLMQYERKHAVIAPPLVAGGQMLALCGAEYRTVGAADQGLQSLRWSEQGATLDAWLRYVTNWTTTRKIWEAERERCTSYLMQVL